eukprot:4974178-Amphidinium_carterae.1
MTSWTISIKNHNVMHPLRCQPEELATILRRRRGIACVHYSGNPIPAIQCDFKGHDHEENLTCLSAINSVYKYMDAAWLYCLLHEGKRRQLDTQTGSGNDSSSWKVRRTRHCIAALLLVWRSPGVKSTRLTAQWGCGVWLGRSLYSHRLLHSEIYTPTSARGEKRCSTPACYARNTRTAWSAPSEKVWLRRQLMSCPRHGEDAPSTATPISRAITCTSRFRRSEVGRHPHECCLPTVNLGCAGCEGRGVIITLSVVVRDKEPTEQVGDSTGEDLNQLGTVQGRPTCCTRWHNSSMLLSAS